MTQISKRRPETPKVASACCGPIDDLLDPELFKALCDPTRLSLIACVAKCGRGCSVGEIAECCSVDMSVVSRHLALLARAGVLEATKAGRSMEYRVRYQELSATLRSLADAIDECCPDASCKTSQAGGACCEKC
jgi:ArsR family transcriptional regulator, arsenate/arsenite/antimonite-responsive transcriptional repressor